MGTAWEEPGTPTIPKSELVTEAVRADTARDAYLRPVLPARPRLGAARGALDADHRPEPPRGLPDVRRAARRRAGHQPRAARPAARAAGAVRGGRARDRSARPGPVPLRADGAGTGAARGRAGDRGVGCALAGVGATPLRPGVRPVRDEPPRRRGTSARARARRALRAGHPPLLVTRPSAAGRGVHVLSRTRGGPRRAYAQRGARPLSPPPDDL